MQRRYLGGYFSDNDINDLSDKTSELSISEYTQSQRLSTTLTTPIYSPHLLQYNRHRQSIAVPAEPDNIINELLTGLNDSLLKGLRKDSEKHHGLEYCMVYVDGHLSLWHSIGKDWELIERQKMLTDKYHILKHLAHLSLKITQNIKYNAQEELIKTYQVLKKVKKLASTARSLYQAYIPYIDTCLTAIEKAAAEPAKGGEISSDYLAQTKPTIEIMKEIATDEVLSRFEAVVSKWMSHHQLNLDKTRTAIVSTKGPRRELIETQYLTSVYQKYLNIEDAKQILNHYVYPTEALPSQLSSPDPDILEKSYIKELILVSIHNRKIGQENLNDPDAMQKDILSAEGKAWIARKMQEPSKGICPWMTSRHK
ncbi:hypothetical protein [Candidatus Berkiella aquae]|uniref:Uncharacterized protein n=1 Tax=Candidatus Berkiella aquae TaxID=295108 RepID=A0A0Q9YPG1_9GAMM|nr:hypothetical protein [Candidatus Berkiella aquae]MCS5709883.1 hypothetical protein [Candidatus Berkiella aquae]